MSALTTAAPAVAATTPAPEPRSLDDAFRECERIARAHYENFTLGSRLLPRPLRRHIAAIYAFARTADDLADEEPDPAARSPRSTPGSGSSTPATPGSRAHPIFVALAETVRDVRHPGRALPRPAGRVPRWTCGSPASRRSTISRSTAHHSANPVGHLVLHLFGHGDAERQARADDICTALQLTNFWQDLAVDLGKGRVYLPREDMARFGYGADDLARRAITPAFRALMEFQCARTRGLFERGLALADMLAGREGREVRLFAGGGLAILERLAAVGYDVFTARPTLSRWAKIALVARTLVGVDR